MSSSYHASDERQRFRQRDRNKITGSLLGFGLGILAWTGLGHFFIDGPSGIECLVFATIGAIAGFLMGGYDSEVSRWCVRMAVAGGAIGFAIGFVGPIIFRPDLPQGPLMGIFLTGPFGVVIGAVLGLVVGVVRSRQPMT